MKAPRFLLAVMAAMIALVVATPAIAGHCACGGEGDLSPWLPRQGLLRFYKGYEPRYPYAWWGGEWRHHGPGEGGYCREQGVKSLHGLGDGCYGRPLHVRPQFLVVIEGKNMDRPPAAAPAPPSPPPPPEAPGGTGATQDAAPAQRSPGALGSAWAMLGRGDVHGALREFSIGALRHPEDAAPKAGYGIAAAMLGRDQTAAWALRRAAATGLEPLHRLAAGDGELEQQVRVLIARGAVRRDGDAPFVTAMLHWLLGEDAAARDKAAEALAAGDEDPAARALYERAGDTKPGPPLATARSLR